MAYPERTPVEIAEAARRLDAIVDLDAAESQAWVRHLGAHFLFQPQSPALIDAILRLFERYPERHESSGLGYLNRVLVYMGGAQATVVASFLRAPSIETAGLLIWYIADLEVFVGGHDLRRLLRDLADDPAAPRGARDTALDWLEGEDDIHPGLRTPGLPVPTDKECLEWETMTSHVLPE